MAKGRKSAARLKRRQTAYDQHGKTPQPQGTDMHRPGSNNK